MFSTTSAKKFVFVKLNVKMKIRNDVQCIFPSGQFMFRGLIENTSANSSTLELLEQSHTNLVQCILG